MVGIAADAPLSSILAHACLALCATDTTTGDLVGVVAFFAAPPMASLFPSGEEQPAVAPAEDDEWIASRAFRHVAAFPAGLVAPLLAVDPEREDEGLTALLLHTFELCPSLTHIFLAAESPVPLSQVRPSQTHVARQGACVCTAAVNLCCLRSPVASVASS